MAEVNNTVDIKRYKAKKKYKKLVQDLKDIEKVLDLTTKAIKLYKHYVVVDEILQVIKINQVVIKQNIDKYEALVRE